ncbi:hypothetical protein SAMN05878281_2011 [Salegentibacter salegens]|uniref:Uncharacterized protein n=1 Tax=Salegentibacter salegens TaxID=143223 RepID=A0A1M7LQT2_9FLAO|nr:hypothetical protein SAMN05878281_2011 [Salegentibacter salegens]
MVFKIIFIAVLFVIVNAMILLTKHIQKKLKSNWYLTT